MNSLILQTVTRFLTVLLTVFSVFVLLRGHNEPGGGFIGGLLVASAFILHTLAFGVREVRKLMRIRVDGRTFIGLGLLLALGSGCISLLAGQPFMTTVWFSGDVPGLGRLGSVLLFDLGVYMVVLGATMTILLGLAEESDT